MHTAPMTPGSSAQSVCEGGSCLVALLAESCILFGTVQRPLLSTPGACRLHAPPILLVTCSPRTTSTWEPSVW